MTFWIKSTSSKLEFPTPWQAGAVPLPQAVPLLGLHASPAGPGARRPLGPLAPPVRGDVCPFLQAVGGLRQVLLEASGRWGREAAVSIRTAEPARVA